MCVRTTKQRLLAYAGNPSQLCGIDDLAYCTGKATGMRLYRVRAGNGLEFDLLPDRCLDIARLSYRGIGFNWLSKTDLSAPPYAVPVIGEFDRYFSGGMLMTCGLKNTGPDYVGSDGHFHAAHGRIGMSPSEEAWHRCSFMDEDYLLEAGASTRDSLLGAHNLLLHRRIQTRMSRPIIVIDDTLENQEPTRTDFLLLYHLNFGYPFVSPSLKIRLPPAGKPILPRTPAAQNGLAAWDTISQPIPDAEEQCFFHHLVPDSDGLCRIHLENPDLGVGVLLAYQSEGLPILTVWKSMRAGEYVLGVEPGNSYLRGMDSERADGMPGLLPKYGSQSFHMELEFYDL